MPIMIPVNIEECPTFPTFDMEAYLKEVSTYATSLWQTMSESASRVNKRKSRLERSQEDIKKGRVVSFNSADEMCAALGI